MDNDVARELYRKLERTLGFFDRHDLDKWYKPLSESEARVIVADVLARLVKMSEGSD